MRSFFAGALLFLSLGILASGPVAAESTARDGKRVKKVYGSATRPAAARAEARQAARHAEADDLKLKSVAAVVFDQDSGQLLYTKNEETVTSIASVTKLMMAMVVLDSKLPLDEEITIDAGDIDTVKNTGSRLSVGTTLPRGEMLRLALMSSENRAASALGRNYPGGLPAFVAAMNRKARALGMEHSHFVDSTGLRPENVSTGADLVLMVEGASGYELIRRYSTTAEHEVEVGSRGRALTFRNSNALVRAGEWDIGLSKTGYISEAGRCLVMQATIAGRKLVIVLLDSVGKLTRIGDANRIRRWLETRFAAADFRIVRS